MLVNLLVALVSLLLVMGLDPFGWDSATDGRIEEVTQGIFSPFYDSTRSAKHVTVVLIDEAYFTAIGQSQPNWPLPVADLLNRILQPIVDAGPRAIFIDLSFPKAPREIAADKAAGSEAAATALGTGIAAAARQGVPIFIADGLTPDRTPGANEGCTVDYLAADDVRAHNILSDEFLRAAYGPVPGAKAPDLTIVSAAWTGDTRAYPLAPTMIGQRAACKQGAVDGKGFMLSPALALYQVYHRTACTGPSPDKQSCGDDALFDAIGTTPIVQADYYKTFALGEAARKPLSVNWGHYVTPEFKTAFAGAADSDLCFNQFPQSGEFRFVRAMRSFLELLTNGGKQAMRRCVYIDTISAGHMFDRLPAPATTGIDDVFLKDRLVIIGVAIPQARDNFVSPINGQIPGAYLHAAAVENLINYGADFKTKESEWPEQLVKFLIVIVVSALFPEIWAPLRRRVDRYIKNPPLALFVATAVFAVIAMILSMLLFAISNSLTNMPLGVLAVPMLVMFARVFTNFMTNFEAVIEAAAAATVDGLHHHVRSLARRFRG